jgi:hypothetical protein
MNWSKCGIFFVFSLLVLPFAFAATNICDTNEHNIDSYGNSQCENKDDGSDDIAEIDAATCRVECSDDYGGTHILSAYAKGTVIDNTNDDVEYEVMMYYTDPAGATHRLEDGSEYYTDWDKKHAAYYGLIDFGYDGFTRKRSIGAGLDEDNYQNLIVEHPYYLWPWFFYSYLDFGFGGNTVTSIYIHKLDYDAPRSCNGVGLELYVCLDGANDNKQFCGYTDNTAIVDCVLHSPDFEQTNGKTYTWYRSIDTEGKLKTSS